MWRLCSWVYISLAEASFAPANFKLEMEIINEFSKRKWKQWSQETPGQAGVAAAEHVSMHLEGKKRKCAWCMVQGWQTNTEEVQDWDMLWAVFAKSCSAMLRATTSILNAIRNGANFKLKKLFIFHAKCPKNICCIKVSVTRFLIDFSRYFSSCLCHANRRKNENTSFLIKITGCQTFSFSASLLILVHSIKMRHVTSRTHSITVLKRSVHTLPSFLVYQNVKPLCWQGLITGISSCMSG